MDAPLAVPQVLPTDMPAGTPPGRWALAAALMCLSIAATNLAAAIAPFTWTIFPTLVLTILALLSLFALVAQLGSPDTSVHRRLRLARLGGPVAGALFVVGGVGLLWQNKEQAISTHCWLAASGLLVAVPFLLEPARRTRGLVATGVVSLIVAGAQFLLTQVPNSWPLVHVPVLGALVFFVRATARWGRRPDERQRRAVAMALLWLMPLVGALAWGSLHIPLISASDWLCDRHSIDRDFSLFLLVVPSAFIGFMGILLAVVIFTRRDAPPRQRDLMPSSGLLALTLLPLAIGASLHLLFPSPLFYIASLPIDSSQSPPSTTPGHSQTKHQDNLVELSRRDPHYGFIIREDPPGTPFSVRDPQNPQTCAPLLIENVGGRTAPPLSWTLTAVAGWAVCGAAWRRARRSQLPSNAQSTPGSVRVRQAFLWAILVLSYTPLLTYLVCRLFWPVPLGR